MTSGNPMNGSSGQGQRGHDGPAGSGPPPQQSGSLQRRGAISRRETSDWATRRRSGTERPRTPVPPNTPTVQSEIEDGMGRGRNNIESVSDRANLGRRGPVGFEDELAAFLGTLNLGPEQRAEALATARRIQETQRNAGAGQPLNAAGTPAVMPIFADYEPTAEQLEEEERRRQRNGSVVLAAAETVRRTSSSLSRRASNLGRRASNLGRRASGTLRRVGSRLTRSGSQRPGRSNAVADSDADTPAGSPRRAPRDTPEGPNGRRRRL